MSYIQGAQVKICYLPSSARFGEAKHDFVKVAVKEEDSDGNKIKATLKSKATSVFSFYYL